ncbi:MAG TPA: RecQ family zinc-binding domain-containing protein [Vicinamibacterales bacterium]|nr:RecQ family zinc-binding domain-containing protein [Vicinamibacterales bacterium]
MLAVMPKAWGSIGADIEAVVHAAPMIAYAQTAGCLRAAILRHFGDPAARDPCGACGAGDRREPVGDVDAPAAPGALPRSTVADSVTGGLSPVRRICNHQ